MGAFDPSDLSGIRDVLGITAAENTISSQPTRLELLGAAGNGIADDSATYAAALYAGQAIYATPGKTYLVTDPTNSLGIQIEGSGRIITPAAGGGLNQQNSRFDDTPVSFRSHLWRLKQRIIGGESLKVVIFGDSTATNGYGLDIPAFLGQEMHNMGLAYSAIVSEAVAGHSWGSRNLATILDGYADQKHLAICKFGINEASTGISLETARATLRDSMRQRLTEIRASTYGGDALSILLIFPNALANNASNISNKNNLWLEMIHQTYVEAAKDFRCALYSGAYIDARNAIGGEARWMDALCVHPQLHYNMDIWGRALREMIMPFGTTPNNRLVFQRYSEAPAPVATAGISQYPRGVSVMRALGSDGYPYAGMLTTYWHPDNTGTQVLDGYSYGFGQRRLRNWITASSAWSLWSGDSVELPLASGFTSFGAQSIPTMRRSSDGLIVLSGALKSTSITTSIANTTEIATLPVGYRPAQLGYYQAVRVEMGDTTKTFCSLFISAAGSIQAHRDCDGDYIGLDGIVFYAPS